MFMSQETIMINVHIYFLLSLTWEAVQLLASYYVSMSDGLTRYHKSFIDPLYALSINWFFLFDIVKGTKWLKFGMLNGYFRSIWMRVYCVKTF